MVSRLITTGENTCKFSLKVELRGIEPLSEGTSAQASPITVYLLTFPPSAAERQASDVSSFINLLRTQSFAPRGPHKFDARFSDSERSEADKLQLGS